MPGIRWTSWHRRKSSSQSGQAKLTVPKGIKIPSPFLRHSSTRRELTTQPVDAALLDGDVGQPAPDLLVGAGQLARPVRELVGRPGGVGERHRHARPAGQGLVDVDHVAAEVTGPGDAEQLALVGEHLQGLLPEDGGAEAVRSDDGVQRAEDALRDAAPAAVGDDAEPDQVGYGIAAGEDEQLLRDGAAADLLELHLDVRVRRLELPRRLLLEPLDVAVRRRTHQGAQRHRLLGERERLAAPSGRPRSRRAGRQDAPPRRPSTAGGAAPPGRSAFPSLAPSLRRAGARPGAPARRRRA